MSNSARTIYIWSFYVLLVGASLAVAPNFVLGLMGLDETTEIWIKLLGISLVLLALYYWDAARNESKSLFIASVMGRGFVVAAYLVLVFTGEPLQLLVFAAVDLVGAIWTYSALKADAAA